MANYLYLDVETTGLNPQRHDVVQIACIPVIKGKRCDPFNQYCQPLNYDSVEQDAVKVHGITIDRMRSFQTSERCLDRFIDYIDSFKVQFKISGYNINFDRSFVGAWFNKHGRSDDYRRLFHTDVHDVMRRAKAVKTLNKPKSFKLVDVCALFNIDISNAHDALCDIRATIDVDEKIAVELGDSMAVEEIFNDTVDESFEEPIPLHLHSEYSMRDSILSMEDWALWCIQNNITAFACPDHNFGISLFKANNPKILISGVNAIGKTSYTEKDVKCIPALSFNIKVFDEDSFYVRINAWAVDNTGYTNLLILSSLGWKNTICDEESKDGVQAPVVLLSDLEQYTNGLVFGLGCEKGPVGQCLYLGIDPKKHVDRILQALPEVVVEMLPFDIQKIFDSKAGFVSVSNKGYCNGNLTRAVNRWSWDQLILEKKIPFIISTAAHFIDQDDKLLQDCVFKSSYKDGRYLWESRHHRPIAQCHAVLNRHLEGAWTREHTLNAISVSKDIAKRCNINVEMPYHLPAVDIPEEIKKRTQDPDKQLFLLLMAKIHEHGRWNDSPEYVKRFKNEVDVICKNKAMNFLPYFLLYEDIGCFARANGILQNLARGSAGGCLISYYLKITHLDPVVNNLPFERFLSHARVNAGSWPDIDSDFGQRGPIVRYLQEKYKVGFAQLGTLQKFKVKSAIKEAMFAVYGRNRNDPEIKVLCDTIPDSPQGLDEKKFVYGYIDNEGVFNEGEIQRNELLRGFFEQYPDIEKLVKRMIGLPANIGRHASGFVISTIDLAKERVPLMLVLDHDAGLINVTQYSAGMVEKCGLIKADILGVKTVDVVADCVAMVKERHGIDLLQEDNKGVAFIYRLPEDADVYEDFYRKKTDSSFQFNTDLVKGFLPEFHPTKRSHLSHLTALCRPGALDVEAIPGVSATRYYIDVQNGIRDIEYIHPDLEHILKETNGTVCFQEQLMEILVKFCGYTLEESDQIRSAIAKKKRDVMVKAFERVRVETLKIGWTLEQAEKLCDVLTAYSNYSFNLSHSRAYSELGYITMWLKRHYSLEWWCSELNHSDEDKIRKYTPILGKIIRSPLLTAPSDKWSIVDNKIIAPLSAVKGIGPGCVAELVRRGVPNSFTDFVNKTIGVRFTSGHFVASIKARAIDCFIDPSKDYMQQRIEIIKTYEQMRKKDLGNEIKTLDPFDVFLMERETNKCFNRTLLSHELIAPMLQKRWPALSPTKSKSIPFLMGDIPVMADVHAAEVLLEKGISVNVGFIGLFKGSSFKSGVSKKGRQWQKVDVILSDGIQDIECLQWDAKKALGKRIDTIMYVLATLQKGWRGKPCLEIIEMDFFDE